MRGIDYFPREDERDWVRLYDRQLIHFQVHAGRDFTAQPVTREEYDNIYLQLTRDNDYNHWRARHDATLEGTRVFWKGVDPLNVDSLTEVEYDRPRLTPFKLQYETIEEVKMRFNKTVILVKGNPFHVTDQRSIKDVFYLLLEDVSQKKSYISVEDIPDLRPAPPGYVKVQEMNGYLMRSPARVNQQGMTSNSVNIKRLGSRDGISFNGPMLVEALTGRGKVLPWDKSYRKLIDDRIVSAFRLSDNIALYKKGNQDAVIVEYKGRRLGELQDHDIKLFDEDDLIQPWVKRDAEKVHLEVTK